MKTRLPSSIDFPRKDSLAIISAPALRVYINTTRKTEKINDYSATVILFLPSMLREPPLANARRPTHLVVVTPSETTVLSL